MSPLIHIAEPVAHHGVRDYLEAAHGSWTPMHLVQRSRCRFYSEFKRDIVSVYSYRMKVCLVDGIEDTSPGSCTERYKF